jgi:F0F1-type ATP synthase epsilon subunit
MKLSIYSLKKVLFQGSAQLLNCKTVTGEITVLENHEPLITVLSAGVIKVVRRPTSYDSGEGVEEYFEIKSGFLEVKEGSEVRCIVEQ